MYRLLFVFMKSLEFLRFGVNHLQVMQYVISFLLFFHIIRLYYGIHYQDQ